MQSMKWGAAALMTLALVASGTAARATPVVGAGVPIVLTDGDSVTVGHGVIVTAVGRATYAPEVPPADPNATSEYMSHADRPPTMTAPTGTVRFTLWANAREGARLKMENNTGRPLIYSAQIVIAGHGAQPTSICSV